MCYFLYIASPLTLSEVRSMLPTGLSADLAPSHRTGLQRLLPAARTVAHLGVGACSCDLFRARQPDPIQDERELRSRYTRSKLTRPEIIRALERHRRGSLPRIAPPGGWPQALAGFVAEHARNAGPTLYLLEFSAKPGGSTPYDPSTIVSRLSPDIRLQPQRWLVEGVPTLVS
jgi:hypothetical protein